MLRRYAQSILPLTVAVVLLAAACSGAGESDSSASVAAEAPTAESQTSIDDSAPQASPVDTADLIGFDEWAAFRGGADRRAFDGQPEGAGAPELLWQAATGGVVESSPAVIAGLAIAGTFDNAVLAFDAATGDEIWRFEVGGLVRASPAVVNGVAYFGADDNLFYAVDIADGSELWRFELGGGGEQSSPTVADGVVYFGGFDNFVYALDAATGSEIWRFETGAGILSSCLLYTSPSPRDATLSRMPSSA